MPDIINLLPDSIANQIAAGEVIQRPSSAVKELLENSVDAGANTIKLIVKDAGKALVQVIDNGSGMSATDARMCFERHATSKIKKSEDLFTIRTMGFRGEALASIAAIAQVELKTKLHDEELAIQINIEGSEVKSQEMVQGANGSSIAIKNLFYNVPARRNFLKSNTVELRHIIDEFQRVALAYPKIAFHLFSDGNELFHLATGNLRQRVVSMFGNAYNERLVPIQEDTTIANIYGFIGKPESVKKTRGEQFFFVNGRFIKSNYFNHAIMNAFEGIIPEKTFPLYVLFIDIDPSRIDVNVHPTKQEIKFVDERAIYTFLLTSTKKGLAKYSVTPSLDFTQETSFGGFQNTSGQQASHPGNINYGNNAFQTPLQQANLDNWEKIFKGTIQTETTESTVTVPSKWNHEDNDPNEFDFREEKSLQPFQLHNKYILTVIKSGFVLIDQRNAHQRVLFEKFTQLLDKKGHASQRQLFPKTIKLTTAESALLKDLLDDINCLGFDIQEFGKNTYVIHGVPSDIKTLNEEEMIQQFIEQYKNQTADLQVEKRTVLAAAMARQLSIETPKELSVGEMKKLIGDLFACENPMINATGKPTFVTFNLKELAKQFGNV